MTTLTEKQLSAILKRPGYSITEPTKRPRPAQLDTALPQGSKHEVRFIQIWGWLGGPELTRELRFCSTRRWRFDFCIGKVAIEVDGFGHQRDNRYHADVEKLNKAAELGYTVFRLTPNLITVNKLQEIIDFIRGKEKL